MRLGREQVLVLTGDRRTFFLRVIQNSARGFPANWRYWDHDL
jgi:hypothetical protein